MKGFDLAKISDITEKFIGKNRRLAYQLEKVEDDGQHVLYQATNLFSVLYCQITANIDLIEHWESLQERLFKEQSAKANRYLVFVVPDSLIKQTNLYEKLASAERDDRFFRKVFIGLPDGASKNEIESSLTDRIPLWFEEKKAVIRQYVPVLSDLIPDTELLKLLLQKTPSAVIQAIEKTPSFSYLFEKDSRHAREITGLTENAQSDSRKEQGLRITDLAVQNFRRFEKRSVDLDGDVVLIYGKNGTGKTTLCDALELSIFPELRRLQGDPDIDETPDQTYAPFLRADSFAHYAGISIKGKDGEEPFLLETTVLPNTTTKRLNGKSVTNEEVLIFLTRNENVSKKGFLDILLHTHFLGQHSIRDFIYGNRLDDDEKITTTRYTLLAEMFGFGEVEHLKKRLSGILSHIKRNKISKAEGDIEVVEVQLRGMKRKYGPKSKQNLEKKGYEVQQEVAVEKYGQIIERLTEFFGMDVARSFIITDAKSMEGYQVSCDGIRSLISTERKALEAQAADLKRLGRLMAKMSATFPDILSLDTASVSKFVEEVRHQIDDSLKSVQQAERDVQEIDEQIEAVGSKILQVRQFVEQHASYLALLETEGKELETLEFVQHQRNELLRKQSDLLNKLHEAAAMDKEITRRLADQEERAQKYERLLESLPKLRTAEILVQQHSGRLSAIDDAITQAEQRLSQLEDQTLSSSAEAQSSSDSLLDLEALRANSHYTCPCCGEEYSDRQRFADKIQGQLDDGKYRQELRAFLVDVERKNTETVRTHLLELIRSYNGEKEEVQQTIKLQARVVLDHQALAGELGETAALPESGLRETIRKHNAEVEDLRKAVATSSSKSLKNENDKIQEELMALRGDSHKEHLANIRTEISAITNSVREILDDSVLRSKDSVQDSLDVLSGKLRELKDQRERLLLEINSKNIADSRLRELDESMSELESLSLGQDALRRYSIDTGPKLSENNLTLQKALYELSAEMDDLSQLFGLLSVEERGDTLRVALEGYEAEKDRWAQCYQNVAKINTDLSKLSSSGLQQSLSEYGPLINQIYQKFIRHDIFAALELKSDVSQKGRRHDLYLRLKSYSGNTKYTPASYLSEAQLNILALSIFLTRVMYQNISELDTVFIDDPIQQMDDMNAAAFVDVILGLSQIGKQIIITTCNHDFYHLVAHKMQSVSSAGKVSFKAVDLDLLVGN